MNIYKIASLIIFLNLNINLFSQVGINTNNPERTLDINGNLKVRNLSNKTSDESYDRVLISDEKGNIEAINREDLKNQIKERTIEIKRLFYNGEKPDTSKKLSCGRFEFSFRNAIENNAKSEKNLDIMLNLVSAPSQDIIVYYTLFRKWGDNDLKYFKSNGKTFKSKGNDYKTQQLLCPQLDVNSTGEFYISYPGENNFYRVLFLGRPNYEKDNKKYNSYTITCEKM